MRELSELVARVAELERRVSGTMRHGRVAEVNPDEAWVRLDFGPATGGGRFLSPKLPYAQTAGALKLHNPPSVGQQMTTFSPSGDWQQAVALPMTWSNQNQSPNSSGEEHELTFGQADFLLKKDSLSLKVGGSEILIETDKITLTIGGSKITMDDGTVTIKSDKVVTDGPTHLDNGGKKLHRVGDVDSDGDVAVSGAPRVFA